ncbi:ABC transporter permease [Paenibacillus sp. MY03]|uniref:ABC transporter permease n=2 Tax=Paenibacillus TaxID=44249 RepID=A0A2R5EQR1_9BACL|nr:ABC transporter permease [Paenibacillus sp. MY03]QNK60403.1 sugar ABC transporter permease [Paenibacillus sp. PAMC21692]GBG09046.1 ABC transporter permease [Paenibacillus agaridevorans]
MQRNLFLLLALTPAFGGYLLFTLYPNMLSVYYSLLNWNGISEPEFVGLSNFVTLFQDKYVWRALLNNLFYMATVPIAVISISLLLGYLLANKGYKGTSFFKVLFFFPNVLSTIVIALLWTFIYDGSFGLLNDFLRLLGVPIGNFYWLGEARTALAAIVPPYVWGGVGLYVIIFMNAMTTIPKSLYESAILEGARHMTILFRITIPLIMPIVRISALFLILGTLKGFEKQLILTNGGPAGATDVVGLYIFNLAFGTENHNYGYASAVGMLLFVILVTAKLLMDKYMPDRSVEY